MSGRRTRDVPGLSRLVDQVVAGILPEGVQLDDYEKVQPGFKQLIIDQVLRELEHQASMGVVDVVAASIKAIRSDFDIGRG